MFIALSKGYRDINYIKEFIDRHLGKLIKAFVGLS